MAPWAQEPAFPTWSGHAPVVVLANRQVRNGGNLQNQKGTVTSFYQSGLSFPDLYMKAAGSVIVKNINKDAKPFQKSHVYKIIKVLWVKWE